MTTKITITAIAMISTFYLNLNAQTINLDTTFGNNGIVSIPLTGEADDLQIIESADNKLFVYGKDVPSSVSLTPNKIYKLNLDGSYDNSFGIGGTLTLPNYVSDFTIIPQGSDKILVSFQKTSEDSSAQISIRRYNLNDGSLDTTFGTAGEFTTTFNGANGFRNNNTVVLSDSSILLSTGTRFIKLLSNGTTDNSYGNNGIIVQNNNGYILRSGSEILNFHNDKISKTTLTGTIVNSFGLNGNFTYPASSYYFSKIDVNGNINSLDLDNNLFYNINTAGSLSNTINLTNDNNTLDFYSNFVNHGNEFYFVGGTTSEHPFISHYNNSGNLVQINNQNSYKETGVDGSYTSLIVKNNSIYAAGDKYTGNTSYYIIAKYNISNASLSANEVKSEKATFNIFPNPVNKGKNLHFNKTQGYELYDMSGKILGKEKSALTIDTSKLNIGVYLIKTSEGEVKRVIVK
ncbi:T9SS type A sorting domain-containing protein [Chryseobacterium aahli]|uniref:T9SS type A sorting domain-containing protein n=1 Tax=Chryseobacterium aahli TaxID=1278643 RepID=UPI001F611BBD|nr:T9SS type A sorting domain-containing protein [Chryseobacterium aahli]MCI3936892.1 T9SS type A sorting domain-containing protein [Chryseobacterium aahli]